MENPLEIARRGLSLRSHRLRSLPVVVLSPHSRCNCRCVMCDIWRANSNGRELSRAQLQPHLETFRRLNVRWVVLTGGEPLMHSSLGQLCELLRELDVKITLLSTGLLLERYREEVLRWSDEVIVSLDGPPAVHDAIRRVPRAFEKLAAGVRGLKETEPAFPVTARSVLQLLNFRHLRETVETARELRLDRLSLLPADVSSEAFNRPRGWGEERVSEVALGREEVAELAQVVEEVIDRFAAELESGFIAESPARLRGFVTYYRALLGDCPFPPVRCNAPWVSTVVEADGTVRPCFFHPALGNLEERPLEEILNGEEALSFRRRLDVAEDPICRRCVCTLEIKPWARVS